MSGCGSTSSTTGSAGPGSAAPRTSKLRRWPHSTGSIRARTCCSASSGIPACVTSPPEPSTYLLSPWYVSAMARVILVSALITAVHPLWTMQGVPEQTELAFAFLVGFFPELGLRAIRQGLAAVMRALPIGTDERFPLRQLDGVTIWVQARFLEEGIEDMQNLARANLVDLMLHTRMPISRLADWVDQSFLYLRVGNGNGR